MIKSQYILVKYLGGDYKMMIATSIIAGIIGLALVIFNIFLLSDESEIVEATWKNILSVISTFIGGGAMVLAIVNLALVVGV